jgi:XTP/dITP diphosphohydrolase
MTSFKIASGNEHKRKEFEVLFSKRPGLVCNESSQNIKLEVEETGSTFEENALLKARAYFDHYKAPTMSDDSGLVVSALPEELGIHSARFGGEGLSDQQRYELLLEKLKGKEGNERSAYFVCVLCFYISPEEFYYFEGRMEGKITQAAHGQDGFGYDPIFHPSELEGLTQNPVNMGHEEDYVDISVAMVPDWKHKHSHRAKACQLALKFFSERDCQN